MISLSIWRNILNLRTISCTRLMSTLQNAADTYNLSPKIEKVVSTHLDRISGDSSHKLFPLAKDILRLRTDVQDIVQMKKEGKDDSELQLLAEKDLLSLRSQIHTLSNQFVTDLVNFYRFDPVYSSCPEVLIEISAGVGGQEAMLFSSELFSLYSSYAQYNHWPFHIVSFDSSETGGLRHGSMLLSSPQAFKSLSLESGVHRVQRVPKTEKSGRIHTSTSTVSILPTVPNIDIHIDDKDLRIETKKASGAGGQHVNTTESAVRITHIPSGLMVDCQTERSQVQNRVTALKMLKNKLYQLEHEKNQRLSKDMKKKQVGLGERSDKIRTFNYLQDRVTDHRFGYSVFNIRGILEGTDVFDMFLKDIRDKETEYWVDRLL